MGHKQNVEILLIEDNPDDVALAVGSLKKGKISNNVHILKDGAEALDFIFAQGSSAERSECEQPQLILLDLNLPKVHGLEVLRKLKGDERTKSIPVIIMTSAEEERGVMQSYKLGAEGCLMKPFEFSKFIEAISELPLAWLLIDPRTVTQRKESA